MPPATQSIASFSKTPQQIAAYIRDIRKSVFASDIDRRMVLGMVDDPEVSQMPYSLDPASGLTAEDFKDWYNAGIGLGDIIKYREGDKWKLGMAGHGAVKDEKDGGRPRTAPVIVAKVSDGQFILCLEDMRNFAYLRASEEECREFLKTMVNAGWYIDDRRGGLVKAYEPQPYDLVDFSNGTQRGAGIVRKTEDRQVEFFCYMIYNSGNSRKSLEKLEWRYPPVDRFAMGQWRFEALNKEGSATMHPLTNGRSVMMKLNRELGRHGMVWDGFQKKIMPLERMQKDFLKDGQMYWYVADNLTVKEAEYRENQTHRARVLAGNAWKTKKEALVVLDAWKEALRIILSR